MTQIIPKVEPTVTIDLIRRDAWVSYRPGDIITFDRHGNGVSLLENGWGEPERWGTWSVASRALLRLSIEHKDTSPVDAVLDYRAFVVPGHDNVTVTCRIHDRDVITWSCRAENPSGSQQITIPGDAISAGTVAMEFLISSPRSPAELGIGSDMRSLGLGIESLQLLPDEGKVAASQHA